MWLARFCRQRIADAEADGVVIDDGNVVDLIADNCAIASLDDIRTALVAAGLGGRFPRATGLRRGGDS